TFDLRFIPQRLAQSEIRIPTIDKTVSLPADWHPPSLAVDWDDRTHYQWFMTSGSGAPYYLPFNGAGDMFASGGVATGFPVHAYWWSGVPLTGVLGHEPIDNYSCLVQGFELTGAGTGSWYTSTSWSLAPQPYLATPFRNVTRGDVSYEQQSLRLGEWGGQVKVVLSTVGGSVLVTTPGTAPWSIDFPPRDPEE